jgi:hypothetical protein
MELSSVNEFETYISKEVKLATAELTKLEENSRKHLQKLVYTNMVDRFDSMVDHVLLDNALSEKLLSEALSKLETPMTEAEVFRLILSGNNVNKIIEDRVKVILSTNLLRNRHSKKLSKLFELCCPDEKVWNEPRVNVSTGKILAKFTPQNNKVPTSVCGYADWIYSRRNSIVHGGGGSTMLENDLTQLEKLFKAKPAKTTKLKLSAIEVTAEFYLSVVKIIKASDITTPSSGRA